MRPPPVFVLVAALAACSPASAPTVSAPDALPPVVVPDAGPPLPVPDAGPPALPPPGRHRIRFAGATDTPLDAVLQIPEARVGPRPAVLVLHGSGGLFREADEDEPGRAPELERQFEIWSARLAEQGWVVLLPASFFSRGFRDWDEHPPALDKEDRLRFRTRDALESLRFLCDLPYVDCARLAMLGFSNGGSTVVLRADGRLAERSAFSRLDPALFEAAPRVAVAYYPGCGLHGLAPLSEPGGYLPAWPVEVHHAAEDDLLEDCRRREAQSAEAARAADLPKNPFALHVYPGAGHGFDSSPENPEERAAHDAALEATMGALRGALDR